jgi:uncharacterized membrane protein
MLCSAIGQRLVRTCTMLSESIELVRHLSPPNPPHPTVPPELPPGQRAGYKLEFGFVGPLPPPQILQGYEQALPGAAHSIIEMAQAQGAHRRAIESRQLEAQIEGMGSQFAEARLGQVFAFCVSALFLLCGTYTINQGHPWPGSFLGTLGVSGIVTTFIRGRHGKNQADKASEDMRKPTGKPPQKRKQR